MNLTTLITAVFSLGLISLVYNNKHLLSLMLSLELILLNLVMYNIYIAILTSNPNFITFSTFIIAISAVEASIGISIITLLSRKFSNTNINTISTLKN